MQTETDEWAAIGEMADEIMRRTAHLAHVGGDQPYDGVLEMIGQRLRSSAGWTSPSASSPERIPPTVYRAFDASGALLYVGSTNDATVRLREHARGSDWWWLAARITLEMHDTLPAARAAEAEAIRAERPMFNLRGVSR